MGITLGVLLFVLALLADMVIRQRMLQERCLLELRLLRDQMRKDRHGDGL